MSREIVIVDYGVGNLFSVARAFEVSGAVVRLASTADAILSASRVVLPGVGAFADGMAGLRERGLVEPLKQYGKSGRPLLGICLGMQMLLDVSEEFGENEGLGLIGGRVVAVPAVDLHGHPHKIPHIGWSELIRPDQSERWETTILQGVRPGTCVYFVHSYTALPAEATCRLADCYYGGRLISAVIRAGPIYGCQFHPEKSGPTGLRILRNFLELT